MEYKYRELLGCFKEKKGLKEISALIEVENKPYVYETEDNIRKTHFFDGVWDDDLLLGEICRNWWKGDRKFDDLLYFYKLPKDETKKMALFNYTKCDDVPWGGSWWECSSGLLFKEGDTDIKKETKFPDARIFDINTLQSVKDNYKTKENLPEDTRDMLSNYSSIKDGVIERSKQFEKEYKQDAFKQMVYEQYII